MMTWCGIRAALAGAVDEFTLLDGAQHGIEIVSTTVFGASAHGHSRAFECGALTKFCKLTGEAELHRYRQKIWWDVKAASTFGTLEFGCAM